MELLNKIFDAVTREFRHIYQVSLRLSDSKTPAEFVDVTQNFLTVSKGYRSISDAIAAKFCADLDISLLRAAARKMKENFNQVEILNRPEILMFGIDSDDTENKKSMKLDFELTLPVNQEMNLNQCKYRLQAFTFTQSYGQHMSFVRDFSRDRINGDWYRYTEIYVEQVITKKELDLLIKYANTAATFAFYVRSDVAFPEVSDNIREFSNDRPVISSPRDPERKVLNATPDTNSENILESSRNKPVISSRNHERVVRNSASSSNSRNNVEPAMAKPSGVPSSSASSSTRSRSSRPLPSSSGDCISS